MFLFVNQVEVMMRIMMRILMRKTFQQKLLANPEEEEERQNLVVQVVQVLNPVVQVLNPVIQVLNHQKKELVLNVKLVKEVKVVVKKVVQVIQVLNVCNKLLIYVIICQCLFFSVMK